MKQRIVCFIISQIKTHAWAILFCIAFVFLGYMNIKVVGFSGEINDLEGRLINQIGDVSPPSQEQSVNLEGRIGTLFLFMRSVCDKFPNIESCDIYEDE